MKSGDLVKIIRYGHNRKIKLDKTPVIAIIISMPESILRTDEINTGIFKLLKNEGIKDVMITKFDSIEIIK